jgi:hypothetical protein
MHINWDKCESKHEEGESVETEKDRDREQQKN